VTPTYDVPAGWLGGSASRKPLVLVNAFAFARSSAPPPDQWMHFARLRPVPRKLVAGFTAIALFCAWGIVGTLTQYGDQLLVALFPLVLMGVGALFFGWAAIRSVTSYRARSGWPHLHGLGIGESGIVYRLAGGDADVPWDSVESISATITNENNPRRAGVPVVRVTFAGSTVDLGTQILGASPLVLYWALIFYWKSPASRGELGTTVAQQRMDDWLAHLTGAPASAGSTTP
jgi:hypothetical protein